MFYAVSASDEVVELARSQGLPAMEKLEFIGKIGEMLKRDTEERGLIEKLNIYLSFLYL